MFSVFGGGAEIPSRWWTYIIVDDYCLAFYIVIYPITAKGFTEKSKQNWEGSSLRDFLQRVSIFM